LQALLTNYMDEQGLIDYNGLEGDRQDLDAYIRALADISMDELVPGSGPLSDSQLAFWVNLYNLATLQLILDNLPLKSIMDINGPATWDLAIYNVGGEEVSLNRMEHGILRPLEEDPRVHFVINCASLSCPLIHPQLLTGTNAKNVLEEATAGFVNSDNYVKIEPEEPSVEISMIFSWYLGDFGTLEDVKMFIADRLEDPEERDFLLSYPASLICFKFYNWNLNIQDPTDSGESDSDGDGVLNKDDNCPSHHNPSQSDRDLDGKGDDCDLDGPLLCCSLSGKQQGPVNGKQVGILLAILLLPALWAVAVKHRLPA